MYHDCQFLPTSGLRQSNLNINTKLLQLWWQKKTLLTLTSVGLNFCSKTKPHDTGLFHTGQVPWPTLPQQNNSRIVPMDINATFIQNSFRISHHSRNLQTKNTSNTCKKSSASSAISRATWHANVQRYLFTHLVLVKHQTPAFEQTMPLQMTTNNLSTQKLPPLSFNPPLTNPNSLEPSILQQSKRR